MENPICKHVGNEYTLTVDIIGLGEYLESQGLSRPREIKTTTDPRFLGFQRPFSFTVHLNPKRIEEVRSLQFLFQGLFRPNFFSSGSIYLFSRLLWQILF